MQRIFYKDDFSVTLRLEHDGELVQPDALNFRGRLYVNGRTIWRCVKFSHVDGECVNCSINDDGTIKVIANSHELTPGPLRLQITYTLPSDEYEDGSQRITQCYNLDALLIDTKPAEDYIMPTNVAAVIDTPWQTIVNDEQVAALGDEVHNVGLQCDAIEADTTAGFDAINKALAGGTMGGGGKGQNVTAAGELKYVRNTMPYNAQPGYRYRYDKGIRLPLGDAGTVIDMSKLFAKINPAPESVYFSCRVKDHSPQVTYDAETQTVTYNEDITIVDKANYQVYVFFTEKSEGKGGNKLFMAVDADGALYICGQYQDSREVLAPPSVGEVLIAMDGAQADGARYIQLQKRVRTVRLSDGKLKKWWADYNVNCHIQHIGVFRARFKGRKYTSRWIYVTYHSQIGIKPI